ncbi:hypothetical protein L9H26_18875 [Morganella psychrotolerans]|uniref:Uncharacterized protein n=1 Tax=Morganella psychrotolerans TaxID=368603 RepID=A0A5M9QX56_9GAMM|nr:hypothetical protein [Morganella psychrotolerans]KAA8712968.1 hypothetical protein F4V73_17775 [Morganella psychrotolerans]OBU01930.1 hypothetical protein AYY16_17130 [Morganella psychrotolerans]
MEQINRSDLVFDLFYGSRKNETTGDRIAEITAVVRDRMNGKDVTTAVFRRITDAQRKKTYELGEVRMLLGKDAFCTAVIEHYRKNPQAQFDNLMTEVSEFLESGLNNSTWIGTFGLRVMGDMDVSLHLLEEILSIAGKKPEAA